MTDTEGATPSSARRWWLPVAAGVLAILSFAATYSTAGSTRNAPPAASTPAPDGEPTAAGPVDPDQKEAVRMLGFYGGEPGPGGQIWRWLAPDATVHARGSGRRWLAFEALSFKHPRALTVTDESGVAHTTQIATRRHPVLLGPYTLDGVGALALAADPGPEQGPAGEKRPLSVFMTEPAVSEEPFGAVFRRGFWAAEGSPEGPRFHWMGPRGTVQVVGEPAAQSAWLSLRAKSRAGATDVSVRGAAPETTIRVEERSRRFEIGPIRLRDGVGSVILTSARPAGRLSDQDAREATIRVSAAVVSAEPSG
jgi:hypothetical protein